MPENQSKREFQSPPKSSDERVAPHLRLTPEEVLENWRNHFYTPAGYLYHLILALRREGWWYRIDNISDFCRKWELNRRTFYRVKAELILIGKLEESITGNIDLRIPDVSQFDSPVSPGSQGVSPGSQVVSHGSQLSLETGSEQGFPDPTDLLQISYSFKEREREAEKFSTGVTKNEHTEPIPQDCPPWSAPTESPPPPQEPPEGTKCSAAAEDDFFDWVLTYKVPRLPQRPASPRSAAKGWIEKHGPQLQAEYRAWLAGPQRDSTDHSGTPPPPRLPPPTEEDPDDRLRRYQALWQNPVCRSGIRRAIEENPDWNLTIGPDGPKEKTDDDPTPNPSEAPPI